MSRIQHLQERATKAEQLAKTMLDALTIERLLAFAAECRDEIARLTHTVAPLAEQRTVASAAGCREIFTAR